LIMHGDPVPDRFVTYAAHQWRRPSVQAWLGKAEEAAGGGTYLRMTGVDMNAL
jgi:hypothetical protein